MPTDYTDSPTVWIVDDDADDQFLLEVAFKQLVPAVDVKLLNDGDELLPALSEAPSLPKLVVIDLNMPRLNGFETLKQLRAISAYQNLPVVVLTTSSAEEDRKKSMRTGATGFFTKPPSLNGLIGLVRKFCANWQLG